MVLAIGPFNQKVSQGLNIFCAVVRLCDAVSTVYTIAAFFFCLSRAWALAWLKQTWELPG